MNISTQCDYCEILSGSNSVLCIFIQRLIVAHSKATVQIYSSDAGLYFELLSKLAKESNFPN